MTLLRTTYRLCKRVESIGINFGAGLANRRDAQGRLMARFPAICWVLTRSPVEFHEERSSFSNFIQTRRWPVTSGHGFLPRESKNVTRLSASVGANEKFEISALGIPVDHDERDAEEGEKGRSTSGSSDPGIRLRDRKPDCGVRFNRCYPIGSQFKNPQRLSPVSTWMSRPANRSTF